MGYLLMLTTVGHCMVEGMRRSSPIDQIILPCDRFDARSTCHDLVGSAPVLNYSRLLIRIDQQLFRRTIQRLPS